MRLFFASFAVLLTLCGAPARADDRGERIAVAKELLVAMHMTDTAKQMLRALMEQIKSLLGTQNPKLEKDLAEISPRMQAKFIASLDELTDQMAAIYADNFSVAELRDVLSFYKSPTGSKLAVKMGQLAKSGMEIGKAVGRRRSASRCRPISNPSCASAAIRSDVSLLLRGALAAWRWRLLLRFRRFGLLRARRAALQHLVEIAAGVAALRRDDIGGRASGDDLAAAIAALGSEIDDPIGRLDDLEIMLDDDDAIALIDEFVQHFEQFCDIVEMQARRRLVENVERAACGAACELLGELDALGLAAR